MEPSQTERGQKWLTNFRNAGQPSAQLLLDSLELIGQDQFREGLQQLVNNLARQISTPIALVPVREVAEGQAYYAHGRDAKPRLLRTTSFPGSEAIVANIAGGLGREKGRAGPFVTSPSLRNMRLAKSRSVVLLDDFSGSGKRIETFFEAYRRHPTIYSWESYHLIEYHVATYAMTPKAHDRLSKIFGENKLHTVIVCSTFANQKWSTDERDQLEALCKEYASKRELALGYDASRALIAFSHTAPNNLPMILWQRSRPGHFWCPFFLEKAVPEDLTPLFKEPSSHEKRIRASLVRLGQKRLAVGGWQQEASAELQKVFLVLAAIARRPPDEARILELTKLSSLDVAQIIFTCRGWNLVSSNSLRLTDEGRAELEHAKKIALPGDELAVLNGNEEPYYPRSLRVGR